MSIIKRALQRELRQVQMKIASLDKTLQRMPYDTATWQEQFKEYTLARESGDRKVLGKRVAISEQQALEFAESDKQAEPKLRKLRSQLLAEEMELKDAIYLSGELSDYVRVWRSKGELAQPEQ